MPCFGQEPPGLVRWVTLFLSSAQEILSGGKDQMFTNIFPCQGNCPGHTGGHKSYCYVLGLGLEPDNVLEKLYDDPLYGTLK